METNNIIYTIDKDNRFVNCVVKVRLNDECKNGHQDFSLTATFWEIGRKRIDKNVLTAGCCHKEILKHFPELKIFSVLHLCDYRGIPMYAVENGFYHIKNGFQSKDRKLKDEFCDYYRVTGQQFDKLYETESKLEYALTLEDIGVLKQWKEEADSAIKLLEELTGHKFVVDSIKSNFHK